jgi:hypothetical protein
MDRPEKSVSGRTYSLFAAGSTGQYFTTINDVAEGLSAICPDQQRLLNHVRKAGGMRFKEKLAYAFDDALIAHIRKKLHEALHAYTRGVKEHLKNIPFSKRFDKTIGTREEGYHLYMLEIELVNRLYRYAFRKSSYKFALLPHCLRDFRPQCRAVPGNIEHVCMGCTEDCLIRVGSDILRKCGIHPYISVTIDQEKLFKKLKAEHADIGALGVACIPELAQAMRLCSKLGISPVGIPLSANLCARWMKRTYESSFSLEELEKLAG